MPRAAWPPFDRSEIGAGAGASDGIEPIKRCRGRLQAGRQPAPGPPVYNLLPTSRRHQLLAELLVVFVDNLLPILLLAGVGCLLAWRVGLEARPLSQVTFAVLGPALVFDVILHSDVPPLDVARMAGFALVTMLLPAALALILGRLRRETRLDLSALV